MFKNDGWECFRHSLAPGSSNVQVAGSEHTVMAQKYNGLDIWGWGEKRKIKAATSRD